MTRILLPALLAPVLVLVLSPAGSLGQEPLSEKQKIEALIKHIEGLQDTKFVRNGVEYDAESAGKFMRAKWAANESAIKTAQDFVEKIATASSTTGMPYLIRTKDGKDLKSGDYLLAELKKLEK